jgi:hypothetical protein
VGVARPLDPKDSRARSRHLVLGAAVLGALGLTAAGCKRDPIVEQRRVTLHAPVACRVPTDAFAYLYGSGEFQPRSDAPPEEGHLAFALGTELSKLPADTRQLVADVSTSASLPGGAGGADGGGAGGVDATWRGLASVAETGPVDILLWPAEASCALTGGVGQRAGSSLVAIDARHAFVTGGTGNPVPSSYVVDLGDGSVGSVRPEVDLGTPRDAFSVTTFTDATGTPRGVVVAGGVDATTHDVRSDAEVFDLDAVGFRKERITLGAPRSGHGAVTLASGATLIAGGVAREGGPVLASLEILDASTGRARTAGLATLAVARRNPTLLRLASGEILVAGGVDTDGNPVATLEWLTPDASGRARLPKDLVATSRRAFIALPGGGALAVVAPPAAAGAIENVWVISADGAIESATHLASALGVIELFAGTDGAPLLWDGTRFHRWQPWSGAFTPAFFDVVSPAGPPADGGAIASPDRGLALWLDRDRVVGLRFDTTGPLTTLVRPLLQEGTARLAPDRLVTPATAERARFEATRGLVLAKDVTAFVTDLTFAGFDLTLETDPDRAPTVVLRDPAHATDYVLGVPTTAAEVVCPLPRAASHLRITRNKDRLTVAADGAAPRACPVSPPPTARLTIGLRGAVESGESTARNLSLLRAPP